MSSVGVSPYSGLLLPLLLKNPLILNFKRFKIFRYVRQPEIRIASLSLFWGILPCGFRFHNSFTYYLLSLSIVRVNPLKYRYTSRGFCFLRLFLCKGGVRAKVRTGLRHFLKIKPDSQHNNCQKYVPVILKSDDLSIVYNFNP
jgi:hypothetical protein